MTTQITVRLPDELVAAVDGLVAAGDARSRASVLEQALARELRRLVAERDAAILAGAAPAGDLEALTAWVAAHPVPVP